jgi:hypothetical protein
MHQKSCSKTIIVSLEPLSTNHSQAAAFNLSEFVLRTPECVRLYHTLECSFKPAGVPLSTAGTNVQGAMFGDPAVKHVAR